VTVHTRVSLTQYACRVAVATWIPVPVRTLGLPFGEIDPMALLVSRFGGAG